MSFQTLPRTLPGVSPFKLNVKQCKPGRQMCVRASVTEAAVAPFPAVKGPHGRKLNFSAGPACLPLDVLEEAQADLLNWKGSGSSVLEMSHRGKEFMGIIQKAEADLRALLNVPANYKILFLQGGASAQFAAIPLNLAKEGDVLDYIVTGSWSKKAADEAKKYNKVNIVVKGDNKSVPAPSTWNLTPGARYVHYCDNETIQGVEFKGAPSVGDALLVADMSSNFCSKPVDVSKYALIYAGAQKNVGPAGVVIVIVREDLIGSSREFTPAVLDYKTMEDSLYNTPPAFAIYVCGLVFAKMLKEGGLEGMQKRNDEKAGILYSAIDGSGGFFNNPVDPAARSPMNIPFTIPSNPDLEKAFVSEASAAGMVQLKGHRSVGGMRASVYNSFPLEGVQTLVAFMKDFQKKHA